MAGVKEHYDQLLAPYYTWICGGFELKLDENREFFQTQGIVPHQSGIAVDLGAGSGFQSVPLSQAGFKVIAIDLSQKLLQELRKNPAGPSIVTIEDDLRHFTRHTPSRAELIVCMGDTITHLRDLEEVQTLIEDASRTLEDDGRMILSFRDLSVELKGEDRFIPVQSDSETVFTCFLEYEKNHVRVYDIVYERIGNRWVMKKSWFRKLRIPPRWISDCLRQSGFTLDRIFTENGMVMIIARKQKKNHDPLTILAHQCCRLHPGSPKAHCDEP